MPGDRILLGVVGRPHGVRGLVHVQSYTDNPQALTNYGPLIDDAGRLWVLVWRRDGIAEIRSADGHAITDRDAAARLTNLRLHVCRDRLPAPAAEEFYLSDLIGLQAVSLDGSPLGTVLAVHDYGAGSSIELSGGQMVPFTKVCVPDILLAARRVTVILPIEVTGEQVDRGAPARRHLAKAAS